MVRKLTIRRKKDFLGYPYQEVTISRQTIVDCMAAWLHATRAVKDSQDIANIQFSDLFGSSDTEYTKLKVFTKGG